MTATIITGKITIQKWMVVDGKEDAIHCWLDETGFHSQRFSSRLTGLLTHKVETILWADIISKAEGQLPLPL